MSIDLIRGRLTKFVLLAEDDMSRTFKVVVSVKHLGSAEFQRLSKRAH